LRKRAGDSYGGSLFRAQHEFHLVIGGGVVLGVTVVVELLIKLLLGVESWEVGSQRTHTIVLVDVGNGCYILKPKMIVVTMGPHIRLEDNGIVA